MTDWTSIGMMIFELAVNVFQSCLVAYFIRAFLGPKDNKVLDITGFITLSAVNFIVITWLNFLYVYYQFDAVISTFFCILYAFICCKGKPVLKFFAALAAMSGIYLSSSFISFLLSTVTGMKIDDIFTIAAQFPLLRIVDVVIVNVLLFFIYKLILRLRNHDFDLFKWTDWVGFIIIPIIAVGVVILILTITLSSERHDQTETLYLFIICVAVIFISIITHIIMSKMAKDSEIKLEYSLLNQQYTYQKQNIDQIRVNAEQMSSLRHDMKNKFNLIENLLNAENITQAQSFCKKCSSQVDSLSVFYNSGNSILDAMLNVKYSLCKMEKIDFVAEIGSSLKNICDIDLCIILGNLLDNAIEAEQKICEDNRSLKVKITEKAPYYKILIKNSISESVLKNNPDLNTTKSNKDEHGIGKKNVEKAVKKYNGEIVYYEEENNFCCAILLTNLAKN